MIAAAGLGIALAVIAIAMRHRRRLAWSQRFAEARNEARWVSQTLIPSLALEPVTAQMMQAWQPASARVMAAEDKLAGLETTAPDPRHAASVRALRDALVASRVRVNELVASPDVAVARAGLGNVAAALGNAVAQATTGESSGA